MADAQLPKSAAGEQAESPRWRESGPMVRWIVAIVLGSVVLHGALIFLLRKSPPAREPVEVEVGSFDFVAASDTSHGEPATFDVHIRFVDDLERPGRELLEAHRYRVREAVENLLRKSQQIELNSSATARLKHEIQEQIDAAIDLRAVAEVIITNLKTDTSHRATAAAISDESTPSEKKVFEPTTVSQGAD